MAGRSEYHREYYKRNRAAYLARSSERWKTNPEYCKAARRAHYDRNTEDQRAKSQQYKLLNPEKQAERQAIYRAANSEFIKAKARPRDMWRKRHTKYSITKQEWTALFESQGQRCGICQTDDPAGRGKVGHWCTDHCHKTGKVRGILCHKCNLGIGHLDDDLALLKQAVAYLEASQP